MLRSGDRFVHGTALEGLKLLKNHRYGRRLSPGESIGSRGVGKQELRERVQAPGEGVFAAAMEFLVREKKLEAAGEIVHLVGRGVVMKDEEAESKEIIEAAFASGGSESSSPERGAGRIEGRQSPSTENSHAIAARQGPGEYAEDLVFHRGALEDLRKRVLSEKAKVFNDRRGPLQGSDRSKPQVRHPLLEYLDREHVTRRVGDLRVIL